MRYELAHEIVPIKQFNQHNSGKKVQYKIIHYHQEKHVKGNRTVQNYLWWKDICNKIKVKGQIPTFYFVSANKWTRQWIALQLQNYVSKFTKRGLLQILNGSGELAS